MNSARINQQPLQKPVLRPALFAGFVWTLSVPKPSMKMHVSLVGSMFSHYLCRSAFFQLYAMVQLPHLAQLGQS